MINEIDIVDRAQQASGLKSDKDFAMLLGLSAQDFSNRKRRGSLTPLVLDWAINEKVNVSFILTGEGEMRAEGTGGSAEGAFDRDLFIEAANLIRTAEIQLNVQIKPEKLGELILLIYDEYAAGAEVPTARILQLVKLAA